MAKARAHTLIEIAAASGVSRKTIQKVFAAPGAPPRTGDLKELVAYVKKAAPGGTKLPDDLSDKLILLNYQTKVERKEFVAEAKEEKRLKNLEKKGRLMERADVIAQGAAIGTILSSTLSGWTKDLPSELVGKSELEITRTLSSKVDGLLVRIREALANTAKTMRKIKATEDSE